MKTIYHFKGGGKAEIDGPPVQECDYIGSLLSSAFGTAFRFREPIVIDPSPPHEIQFSEFGKVYHVSDIDRIEIIPDHGRDMRYSRWCDAC